MRLLLLLLTIVLTGCEHPAGSMGNCYEGAFTSFCVVQTPPGTTAVAGTGIVPSIGALVNGVGSMMTGEGTIINGATTLLK